jgi:hypothetical protein
MEDDNFIFCLGEFDVDVTTATETVKTLRN